MSEPRSSIPWPVWALVTILVAALSSPFVYQYFKDSRTVPQSGTIQPAATPQFTYGTWTLHDALSDDGFNWSNSVLKITSQNPVPDGLDLKGYFEWRLDNVLVGTEYVSGHHQSANRHAFLEGNRVTEVPAVLKGAATLWRVHTRRTFQVMSGALTTVPGVRSLIMWWEILAIGRRHASVLSQKFT